MINHRLVTSDSIDSMEHRIDPLRHYVVFINTFMGTAYSWDISYLSFHTFYEAIFNFNIILDNILFVYLSFFFQNLEI